MKIYENIFNYFKKNADKERWIVLKNLVTELLLPTVF